MASETEKPPKRMTCWNCRRYSRTDRRCLEGKANPKRKSDSFAVAESLGLRALCHFNPYRDGLAMRMLFPTDPATIRLAAQSRKGRRRRTLFETVPEEAAPAVENTTEAARGSE